jgi:hypothetical protein
MKNTLDLRLGPYGHIIDKFDTILLKLLDETMGEEDVAPYEKRWEMAASSKDSVYREALTELANSETIRSKHGDYWIKLLNRYKKKEIGSLIYDQIQFCMWQELGNYIPIIHYPEAKALIVLKNMGCKYYRSLKMLGGTATISGWFKYYKYVGKNRYEALRNIGFAYCRVYIHPVTGKFSLLPGKPGQNYTSDGGSPPR